MDMSSILGALLSDDSVNTMSKKTQSNSSQVQDVVSMALPYLLKGMGNQAGNKDTVGALVSALTDHSKKDASDVGSFLDNVDPDEGAKVVGHLLGSDKDNVTEEIAKKSGIDTTQVLQLLATAAPLVMNLVGTHAQSQKPAAKPKKEEAVEESGGGDMLASILGDVLKGLLK